MLDYDEDGWPDLVVANDRSPNRLYRNRRNGTFEEIGLRAGIAFSEDGKARAGMGVDVGGFRRHRTAWLRNHELRQRDDRALPAADGCSFRRRSRAGRHRGSYSKYARFRMPFSRCEPGWRAGLTHREWPYRRHCTQHPSRSVLRPSATLIPERWPRKFHDVAGQLGKAFATPRIGRGLAIADFDRDGDLDVLITTNGREPLLLRNDLRNGNRGIRLRLQGKRSNRDAIGAVVKLFDRGETQWRMVHSGSSYLSQSELALTFGVASEIEWSVSSSSGPAVGWMNTRVWRLATLMNV